MSTHNISDNPVQLFLGGPSSEKQSERHQNCARKHGRWSSDIDFNYFLPSSQLFKTLTQTKFGLTDVPVPGLEMFVYLVHISTIKLPRQS